MTLPASGEHLLVSERFVSLQGEGVSAGAPAAFLRLGNCNLACAYCDTPYTWDQSRFDLSQELSPVALTEVEAWVSEHAPGRLIVTGGEPLLQHKLIARLLDGVDENFHARGESLFVEIETNGTVRPSTALLQRVDQWNVSVKLACSQEPFEKRIKPDVIEAFSLLTNAYFKFVVQTSDDAAEVDDLVQRFALDRGRVLLMPEASSAEQLANRQGPVAAWALVRGYRFSGRLHLQLYGGRRGS